MSDLLSNDLYTYDLTSNDLFTVDLFMDYYLYPRGWGVSSVG